MIPSERSARAARRGVGAHRSSRVLLRRRPGRRRPLHNPDVASLLVDRDDRLASGASQARRQRAQLIGPADVAAEQDHTGHTPLAQRVEDVVGRRRAGEAEDDELADLLRERELIDGCPTGARRPRHDERESDQHQESNSAQRATRLEARTAAA